MQKFVTENGIEIPAVTASQMREIDRIAMEETGPNLFQMMENAGRNLASLAIELLGRKWHKAKIIVLTGTGGNGGGGICAARHLANRNIDVGLCISNPQKIVQVPQFQHKIYQNTQGKELKPNQLNNAKFDLSFLERYGLKFEDHICTLKVAHDHDKKGELGKHNLQYLRYYYDLKFKEVYMIGDKETADITPAKIAGLTTIRIKGKGKYNFDFDSSQADYKIESISELLKLGLF